MAYDSLAEAIQALSGASRDEVERAVHDLGQRLPNLPEADFRAVVEGLCSLFYIDAYDRPDLEPALDLAVHYLGRQGVRVVPLLLEFMEGSDIKSHMHLAQAVAAVGSPALAHLRRFIATADDPYSRSFGLFALGKLRDPAIEQALPEVLGALMHPDQEVRDSASRTLGKIAQVVPPDRLTLRRRTEMFEALFRILDDRMPGVRAKGVRSLGKLAAAGYLTGAQEDQLRATLRRLLGHDDAYDWDKAFIVRREAEEALIRLDSRPR